MSLLDKFRNSQSTATPVGKVFLVIVEPNGSVTLEEKFRNAADKIANSTEDAEIFESFTEARDYKNARILRG